MLRVGIIGVGTVGASVANILRDNKILSPHVLERDNSNHWSSFKFT